MAEDDVEFRTLLSLKLRGGGFDVTEAGDGKELLERLIDGYWCDGRYDPFDIVLSDINMPHFDALDVLARASSCLTTTPVVLMTAFAEAHTREQARRLGATVVLSKPLQLNELCARLVAIIRRETRVLH